MRADIHEGPEHMLQSQAGYIDARPHRQDRRNLLHRTAGPYIGVKLRPHGSALARPVYLQQRTYLLTAGTAVQCPKGEVDAFSILRAPREPRPAKLE